MRARMNVKTLLATAMAAALAAQPVLACTGIMLKATDGSLVHGRTVEFGITIESSIAAVPRGQAFTGKTPNGDGMKYNAKYAAVGAVAFKDIKILDGMNETGLAVGAFYFPTFAKYAALTPQNQNKGLSPADFPNWILTQFGSVDEVRRAVEAGEAIVAPTVLDGWGSEAPPFHYVVYDKQGASIVIEPIEGRLVIHDNPLGVMTNSPNFDWHMTNLRNYISLSPNNAEPVKIAGQTFSPLGQGSGLFGLPGDFTPPSRFVRAAIFTATATPSKDVQTGIDQVFHILNNFDIPLGASRDVSDGAINADYTMLTTARDPQNLRYYYKSYEDQTIRMVDLKQMDLNAKGVKLVSTKGPQPIADMTSQVK